MRMSLAIIGAAVGIAGAVLAACPPTSEPTAHGVADSGARASVRPLSAAPPRMPRLNVVVVMADDMRADDLRFAPHLRALAHTEGLDFRNAFSPFPLCCPARASFLTGRYAHNHHVYWHEEPWGYGAFDDSRTLATSLHAVGYQTGYVGKHLNRYGLATSKVSGQPSYRYVPNGWDEWIATLDGPSKRFPGSTYAFFRTSYNHNGTIESHREYSSRTIARYSEGLIDRFHRRAAPFFLSVNFVAPHVGRWEKGDPKPVRRDDGVLQEFPSTARPDWIRGRWDSVIDRGSGMPSDGGPAELNVADNPPGMRGLPELNLAERVAVRETTRQRAEAVTVMDHYVQQIVNRLIAAGEWDRTIFFFTSDNGFFQGEHRMRSGKLWAHEPSLRVPLLATGPEAMRAGRNVYDPASLADLTATILDIADASPPRLPDGHSLLPTMVGGDRGWDVPVVTEAVFTATGQAPGFDDPRTSVGLRTARYSYTRYRNGFEELYDLATDPLQNSNKASVDSYRLVRRELRLLWWFYKDCRGASCQAPLPADLAATPDWERTLTVGYWTTVRRVYGFPTR